MEKDRCSNPSFTVDRQRSQYCVDCPADFVEKWDQTPETPEPQDRAPSSAVFLRLSVHDWRMITHCERPNCFRWLTACSKAGAEPDGPHELINILAPSFLVREMINRKDEDEGSAVICDQVGSRLTQISRPGKAS